jgi:hypothetical protein
VSLEGFAAQLRRVMDGLRTALPTLPGIGGVMTPTEPLLGIGEEDVPVDEQAVIEKINELMRRKCLRDYPLGSRPVRRGAHAKHHGLCKAELRIAKEIPGDLRYGLFAHPGRTHKAWLRFSNAGRKPQADSAMDGRGLAIKVCVDEDASNPDSEGVQDFLLVNMLGFFARTAADFLQFALVETDDRPTNYFFSLLPPKLRVHALLVVLVMTKEQIGCPFDASYYSVSPYQCGSDAMDRPRAVKFRVRRVGAPQRVPTEEGDPFWEFRDAMQAELSHGDVELGLYLQRQVDGRVTPVEDPTIEWTEEESSWVQGATLRIAAGDPFSSHERMALGEVLSFNPWHCLPEHRPLGGINRIRKLVYSSLAALRWEMNGTEPPPNLWDLWEQ